METKEQLVSLGHEPTPVLKSIQAKCLDCSGGSKSEVRHCVVQNCMLYPFRLGKNPWREPRKLTEDQRAAIADRLHKSREVVHSPSQ